ncbi:MAG: cytochrome c [Deltaproteobacteria bacterium]|nr:cytochrome c [Deltaproteobacteria bacterium]
MLRSDAHHRSISGASVTGLAILSLWSCGGAQPAAEPRVAAASPAPGAPPEAPAAPATPPADGPTDTPAPAPPTDPAPPATPSDRPPPAKVHLADSWYPGRAERLGLELATAKERDASFAEGPPEDGLWWDPQLAEEVWNAWSGLCSECHEGSRSLAKVLKLPPPRRGWARKKARFFAKDRLPREVFAILRDGAEVKDGKDMPAWGKRLSNEQMWGLVYFVRAASERRGHDLR